MVTLQTPTCRFYQIKRCIPAMNKVISFPSGGAKEKTIPLRSLDDLIHGCKKQEKAAFDELFQRHMGLIIKEIRRVFRSLYIEHLGEQENVVQDILRMITEKTVLCLIRPSKPHENEFRNPRGFPKWLINTTRSQTFEWLRQQNRKNNVIKKRIQAVTGSLDSPFGKENALTLKDILADKTPDLEEASGRAKEKLDQILPTISALNPLERLLMRIDLIFYDSLEETDIKEIAERRQISPDMVRAEAEEMVSRLVEKNEKRIEEQGKEQILWYRLRDLEFRKTELQKDSLTDKIQMQEIEEELAVKSERLTALRKKGRSIIRPTNKEIARFMNMSEKDAKNISTKLFRIRKKLNAGLKKDEQNNEAG